MRVVRRPTGVLSNLKALAKLAGRMETRVGWLANSAYPDDRGGADVAYVAAIMEYGYAPGKIPARPIMAPTFNANVQKWYALMARNAQGVVDGRLAVRDAFVQLGLVAQGDIQVTIRGITTPPLKESTLRARARRKNTTLAAVPSKPLEDSGLLISTVSHEVKGR